MNILKKGILALSFAAAAFGLGGCSDNTNDIVKAAKNEAEAVDKNARLNGIDVTVTRDVGGTHESYVVDFATYKNGKVGELKVVVDATLSAARERSIYDARVISYKADISDTLKLR